MNNRALRILEARGWLCGTCGLATRHGAPYCPNCQFELDELEALARLEEKRHYAIQPGPLYAPPDEAEALPPAARKAARRLTWSNWIYIAAAIAVEWWMVWEFVHAAWKGR